MKAQTSLRQCEDKQMRVHTQKDRQTDTHTQDNDLIFIQTVFKGYQQTTVIIK